MCKDSLLVLAFVKKQTHYVILKRKLVPAGPDVIELAVGNFLR